MGKVKNFVKTKKITTIIISVAVIVGMIVTVYAATENALIPGAVDITFKDANMCKAVATYLSSEEETENVILKKTDNSITILQSDLDNIKVLVLNDADITDISGIEDFTNLNTIQMYNNNISDLTPLKDNQKIEILSANGNKLDKDDLNIIASMSNLQKLGIGGNQIANLEELKPLSSLNSLIELTFSYNNLTNLNGIENFPNLENLYVGNNEITDFSKLNILTKLSTLDVSENNISDISVFTTLPTLKELQIFTNNIEDISSLQNNSTIETLNLNGNKLNNDDLDTLKTMTSLKKLGLGNNEGINKIGTIADLTNLTELTLSQAKISDITGIDKLVNLEKLDAQANEIENIDVINSLTKLTDLNLENNKISSIPDFTKLENLKQENINISNQIIKESIYGEENEDKTMDIPQLFKSALEDGGKFESEILKYGGELDEENKKFNCNMYNISIENNIGLEIADGPLRGSKYIVQGTTIGYFQDVTNDENLKFDLDINFDEKIDDEDLKLLKAFYSDESIVITDEEQEKILELDLYQDGIIDEKDYNMFKKYIDNNKNGCLAMAPTMGMNVNTDIIAKIITSVDNLELNNEKVLTQNGEYEFNFKDVNGNSQTLIANVNFIDKTAPNFTGPVYSTTDDTTGTVNVTITSDENLCDIYTPITDEENDENIKEDTGWRIAVDNRTITKTYTENTHGDEIVPLVDEAGNITNVKVNVSNIITGENGQNTSIDLSMKSANNEDYISGTWTNSNITLNVVNNDDESDLIASYSINGEGNYTGEHILTDEGKYEIKLKVKESNGNITNRTYNVNIDKTEPTVGNVELIENNANGKVLNNNSVTDQNVYIHLYDSIYGKDELSGHYKTVYTVNGNSEKDISSIVRENGNYEVIVTTYDNAGNTSSRTYNFTINR